MWCRAIRKLIADITQDEIENMCIEPERDCALCMFCTAIGGTKLTEIEQENLNRAIKERTNKNLATDGRKEQYDTD